MKKLSILVADDHSLVRRGARDVLHGRRGWRVVAEAVNGREAVQRALDLRPDIAVLDIGLPDLDGIEVARKVRKDAPAAKVLMLTMHESDHMVQRALDAGAHGYILKTDLSETLVTAVKGVLEGERFLTPRVSEIMKGAVARRRGRHPANIDNSRTTPREAQVIRSLAEGKTNRDIAEQLGIAVRTVEGYRAKVMLKFRFGSLAELIHYAIRHGMAEASPNGF